MSALINYEVSIIELLARRALKELSARYARGVDRRDFALYGSVFHPDATVDFGNVFSGTATDFVSAQGGLLADYELTSHNLMNMLFDINGEIASGEVYFLAYHRARKPNRRVTKVSGRYLDRYERRDQRWRILRRQVVWDQVAVSEVSIEESTILESLGPIGEHLSDPSFAFLCPEFRNLPVSTLERSSRAAAPSINL